MSLKDIPAWLGSAVIGVVFAVLGYLAKAAVDWLRRRRSQRQSERSELLLLSDLLAESKSIFRSQNFQARRLMELLRKNHPDESNGLVGFDETFTRLFESMNDEERELHSLIRSTNVNSMRKVNQRLRSWVERNRSLTRSSSVETDRGKLATELLQLSKHLNEWFDKYEAWIPKDDRKALVYLKDEKEHGTGFPKQLEAILSKAMESNV